MEQHKNSGDNLRVVVIGAGIIGASIAFNLTLRGAQVTIVEATQPGTGCSGHSFAWLNSYHKEPAAYHDFNRRSLDMWDRFTRRLGADVGVRWGGQMTWESTPEGAEVLSQRVRRLQSYGYPSRIIDLSEMRRLEPGLHTGVVTAAALNDIDGQADPYMVIQACLSQAKKRGALVLVDTKVTNMSLMRSDSNCSRVRLVHTAIGDIQCDVVVLAAGVDTSRLASTVGIGVPLQESPGVVVRTEPRSQVLQTISVLYAPSNGADQPEIHLRQAVDGSMLIGEGTQESLARDDSQQHANDLLNRASHYLPALSGATAFPVPVGYRPMPLDGWPIIGFAKTVTNLYVAVMHSGITLAPIVGELATLEIMDGARVELLNKYRLERFN